MEPVIVKDADELSKEVAEWMIGYIEETLLRQDRFCLVLSGGSTPKKLYQLLASPPYRERIDWKKMHFFWGDERYVPFADDRNNAHMAFEQLLKHVPVEKELVHIMRTDIEPDESVREYEKILHRYFDGLPFSFDLVLLGMGDNAHTLSLFPGYENIHEKQKWVMHFFLKEQNMTRITLTAPIINLSARIAFLVTGADKAMPVYQVLYGQHFPDLYPAQLVQPYRGQTHWFLDQAAATEVENNAL